MPRGLTAVAYPTPLFSFLSRSLSLSLSRPLFFCLNTRINRHARTVKLPAHVGPLISCATRGTAQRRVDGERFSVESWIQGNFWKTKIFPVWLACSRERCDNSDGTCEILGNNVNIKWFSFAFNKI